MSNIKTLLQSLIAFCIFIFSLAGCGGGGGGGGVGASGTGGSPTYTVSGSIVGLTGSGLVLSNNNNDHAFVPNSGINFTFPIAIANGSAYAVSILTQPVGQTCNVTNGNGVIANASIANLVVNCAALNTPKFAYIANSSANSISAYAINAATGALTPVTGSPFAAGTLPISVATDPLGRFVYVANQSSGNISAYTINTRTGALTAVAGSPFLTGMTPRSVAVDPSGRFVYAANLGSGTISAYTINPSTGALSEMVGSPFGTGVNAWASGPYCITIDPWGKFVYVADQKLGFIETLKINTNTGVLSAVNPSLTPGATQIVSPTSIAVDPTGKFVYLVDQSFSYINAYTINSSSGTLTEIPNSRIQAAAYGSTSVAIDPLGKFAYVSNQLSAALNGNVSAFTINALTGGLTQITGSPFPSGINPIFITVDPSGKFAYAANSTDNTISAYAIDSNTGTLTTVTGSPFSTGIAPTSIAITK